MGLLVNTGYQHRVTKFCWRSIVCCIHYDIANLEAVYPLALVGVCTLRSQELVGESKLHKPLGKSVEKKKGK